MPLHRFRKKRPTRRAPTTRRRIHRRHKRSSQLINKTSHSFVRSIYQLFPDRMVAKLRNFYTQTFTATSGAITAAGVIGNALHTPIAAAQTGANALSFSSSSSIVGMNILLGAGGVGTAYVYNQYRIFASRIKLRIMNTSGGSTSGTLVLFPNTEYTNLGNVNAFVQTVQSEYPYAKTIRIAGTEVNKGVTVNHFMTTARQYGLKYKSSLEDSLYDGAYGTNPSNTWGWIYTWFPDTGSTSSLTLICEIVYTIEFFDRSLMTTGSG